MNDKEKKELSKEYQLKYQAIYRKKNAETLRLKRKENDEQIKEARKKNSIKTKEYNSLYREQNKTKSKAVTMCLCGGRFQYYYQNHHNTSIKHIAYCELIIVN